MSKILKDDFTRLEFSLRRKNVNQLVVLETQQKNIQNRNMRIPNQNTIEV